MILSWGKHKQTQIHTIVTTNNRGGRHDSDYIINNSFRHTQKIKRVRDKDTEISIQFMYKYITICIVIVINQRIKTVLFTDSIDSNKEIRNERVRFYNNIRFRPYLVFIGWVTVKLTSEYWSAMDIWYGLCFFSETLNREEEN